MFARDILTDITRSAVRRAEAGDLSIRKMNALIKETHRVVLAPYVTTGRTVQIIRFTEGGLVDRVAVTA